MRKLTPRQSEILRQAWSCLQRSPYLTVPDLVRSMGMVRESSLIDSLKSIEGKGYLTIHRRGQGNDRFIEVTAQGISELQGVREWMGLPVVGRIPAGPLSESIQDITDYINPGNALRWKDGDFLLRVNGRSMSDRILDGDLVLIRPNQYIYSGEIVAAQVWTPVGDSCEGTLKYAHFQTGEPTVILKPENPEFEPMKIDAALVTFAGVFRGLLRMD